jgi:hemolysin D
MDRLQALLEERSFEPDTSEFDAATLLVQKEIYCSTLERIHSRIAMKQQELSQIQEQTDSTIKVRDRNQYLVGLDKDRLNRLKTVRDIISKDEFDKVEMDYRTHESEMRIAGHKIEELAAAKRRLGREIAFIQEDERNRLLAELAEKRKQHLTLKAEIKKTAYLNARQQISAPVSGYINKMLIHTVGGVVTPAEKLISLVPDDSPLVVKALVQNKDIGFIAPGMAACIKVDTFNFQKYGILNGRVDKVGKDSLEDKTLGLVYEAYITPHETRLLIEGIETPIATGMSVTAEIKVGKRRIIEFFIYPIIKYLDEGISVR